MKNSTLFALFGILAFLGLISLVFRQISRPGKPLTAADANLGKQAVRFEISGTEGEFVFVRSGKSWRMKSPVSYPADSDAIKNIIDRLPQIRLSDFLSSEPSRYGLFGLQASSRTRVRIFTADGKKDAGLDFYAGKEGTEINSFYLKFADKKEVMQAGGLSPHSFSKPASDWLDKTIIDVPPEKISGISVKSLSGGGGFEITRSSSGWSQKLPDGSETVPQSETVATMLQHLAGLKADKAIPGKAENLAGPDMTIAVSLADKSRIFLKVSKTKDKTRRCIEKSEEKRVHFLLADWKLKQGTLLKE